jgi:hypothetical protein
MWKSFAMPLVSPGAVCVYGAWSLRWLARNSSSDVWVIGAAVNLTRADRHGRGAGYTDRWLSNTQRSRASRPFRNRKLTTELPRRKRRILLGTLTDRPWHRPGAETGGQNGSEPYDG